MPRRPIGERAMTAAERQKRYRQAVAFKTPTMAKGSDGTPSITLEDLAETFYRLYWRGRLNASRPLDPDVGDWADEVERSYWQSEVRRLVAGRPLEILQQEDEAG